MLDYLESIVFIHRMFALVDVPYRQVLQGKADDKFYAREVLAHLAELAAQLIESDGLNYAPKSQDGSFNDVAFSDARALIKHLAKAQQRIGSTAGSFINDSTLIDGGTGTFNNSQYMDDDLNVSLRDQLRK